jgi:hypothetical protein
MFYIIPEETEDNDDDTFYYDLDTAADTVWMNIPQYLREKFNYEQIFFILETEFDYLDSIGIMKDEDEEPSISDYPRDINQPLMEKIMVETANKNNINLDYEDVSNILEAELIYYEANGALRDAGEYLN